MKVLFNISTLANAGAERAMSNITTHLSDDVEADILLNSVSNHDYPTDARIICLGMDPNRKKNIIYKIEALHKRIRIMKKLKKENNYDASISFLDIPNIANIISGNKYCKNIVSIRVSMISEESKLGYKIAAGPLMKLFYSKADKIVTCSKEIENEMKGKFKIPSNKIVTITNGYDVKLINEKALNNPGEFQIERLKNKKIITTVGRLCEQKGHWHLIRAFSEVVKNRPDAVLLVIGTGEYKDYLEQIIKEYRLYENVFLMGYSSNPYFYIKQSDAFILPSMYEGYPNALAEAICCGVPCIATDFHSGARELLAPDDELSQIKEIYRTEYGILTPLCSGRKYLNEELELNEKLMAEAILKLVDNSELNEHYRTKSIERRDSLNIDNIVKKWWEVIA